MKDILNTEMLKEIIAAKRPCLFVSPHLDDAVYSAGGLMYHLTRQKVPVILVNVFTKASPPPYTISVRKFLASCGYKDADALYRDRIKEDQKVTGQIGARAINLGLVDALWRRKTVTGLTKKFSAIIPELAYIYPVWRFSIARGKISPADQQTYALLEQELKKFMRSTSGLVIFCPLGIGGHVDHLIVRDVCTKVAGKEIVYWEDYPYLENTKDKNKFVDSIKRDQYFFAAAPAVREGLVNGYQSQTRAIFGVDHVRVNAKEAFQI